MQKYQGISLNEINIGSLLQNKQCDTVVITVNICKIGVHSHKSYIVYIKICKVCFHHLCLQGKCTYVTFIYHGLIRFQFFIYPTCGRYIWEIFEIGTYFGPKFWLLIGNLRATIKISISAPAVNQIYFLVTWVVLANL